jgi:type II secretory pathway pseudopilin PulG
MDPKPIQPDHARRGLSLIETVLSLLILGGAFVALLNTVGSARSAQAIAAERQLAFVLAEDMMSEVMGQDTYMEDATIGLESGETLGDRSAFDDVDDYHNWSATPPVDRDGVAIAGAEGYTREVTVDFRRLANTQANSATDQGVLRVQVVVKRGDKTIATLNGLRTDAWQAPEENY